MMIRTQSSSIHKCLFYSSSSNNHHERIANTNNNNNNTNIKNNNTNYNNNNNIKNNNNITEQINKLKESNQLVLERFNQLINFGINKQQKRTAVVEEKNRKEQQEEYVQEKKDDDELEYEYEEVDKLKRRKFKVRGVNSLESGLTVVVEFGEWTGRFKNIDQPIHLDLGCGLGDMLINHALTSDKWNHIGMDIRDICIEEANDRLKKLQWTRDIKLGNIAFVNANAQCNIMSLQQSLPTGSSIERISIMFPDPWRKKRYSKRRLVNANLIDDMVKVLPSGGRIYIMTDVQQMYQHILDEFASSPTSPSIKKIEITEQEWLDAIPRSKRRDYLERAGYSIVVEIICVYDNKT
ncbi:tRNA (guanine-N(7))-methyltransferase [Cavenderia fasciculata]|uniref:tRNA (guanine(46)-N(7))-methyltransferase n=1 Tax=Cavenderia fasciculata TaxID=261658 RepID=F4PK71_CACFS|nr:tRNA (guanine-N(7))-methyltransferase [Cavenderia fasciculata]EGG23995.1 tRNA (guanine-N(7))-methyltransferase [Cavenderia fasciculata]|eukprot:XP_004361846.1 tRNA (guanine-N(7))-methyltransferase [Cavenderia fasciculata]